MQTNPQKCITLPNGVVVHKTPDFRAWFYKHHNPTLDRMMAKVGTRYPDTFNEIQEMVSRDTFLMVTKESSIFVMRLAHCGNMKVGEKVFCAGNMKDLKILLRFCEWYSKMMGCSKFTFTRDYKGGNKHFWDYKAANVMFTKEL